ncbi:MarR family winged helix-turn-helix transcriptional regulator [Desulfovibrio psychrotolerans]|uniref:HTH marR-type domain-containing protein n=1 Tax=Desulfovibrio psychrotolerans TaxID=415242 RepID=A0A7J0BRS4_9BACT|nr:MarR family transcriptional regulator [Desulfovibrio psychrotolerans]GFM35845.1 hypothetical protein DSM19430T_05290 [Desulfovibrio psychrotolerans]
MHERRVSFGYRIGQLHRLAAQHIRRNLAPLGIEQGQVPFLAELFHEEGQTQEMLAARLHIDKGVTARTLARLEEAGLVLRRQNPANRRQKLVYLAESMRSRREEFFAPLHRLTEELAQGFSEEERAATLALLDRMIGNLCCQRIVDDEAVRGHAQCAVPPCRSVPDSGE